MSEKQNRPPVAPPPESNPNTPAQEWGERVETAEQIARGGKEGKEHNASGAAEPESQPGDSSRT